MKEIEKKKITKEQMENLLQAFFPGGYSRDRIREKENDYIHTWYLGWLGIDYGVTLPLEINLDAGGTSVVFMWWPQYCEEYSKDEIIGFIRGIMSQLMPDMKLEGRSSNSNTIMFEQS